MFNTGLLTPLMRMIRRKSQRQPNVGEIPDPARRAKKIERLRPFLRNDMAMIERSGKLDFLTCELRAAAGVVDTENVSSHPYPPEMQAVIDRHSNGLVLDAGAGSRPVYLDNVVNFEIVDYPSTDILGVGEELPFKDGTFDAVLSNAVLEHVRDPFKCAREIVRVLKPGGEVYCCYPLISPVHGYPNHYFNATPQGLMLLFQDGIEIDGLDVIPSTHPIWALRGYSRCGRRDCHRFGARSSTIFECVTFFRPKKRCWPRGFARNWHKRPKRTSQAVRC